MNHSPDLEHLARIVIRGLASGESVEIDGLGVFYPDPERVFRFEPRTVPQVFCAYVREDRAAAERLCNDLEVEGFAAWIDVRKLLPGQNWPRAIETAIETSRYFVALFSTNSVDKRGGFQAEIRYALDCARQIPLDEIFIVPVRLDNCRIPRSIQRAYQFVDLFPDWPTGIRRLTAMMRMNRREGRLIP